MEGSLVLFFMIWDRSLVWMSRFSSFVVFVCCDNPIVLKLFLSKVCKESKADTIYILKHLFLLNT